LRFEKEMKRAVPISDFFHETQLRDFKLGRMPEYLEQFKGRDEHASYLGCTVVAKVRIFNCYRHETFY
jgi:hypothetical protein